MTEDKLEKMNAEYRKLQYLQGWLDIADKASDPRDKVDALFEISDVYGWISDETLLKCYNLVRPELEAARDRLQREWDAA